MRNFRENDNEVRSAREMLASLLWFLDHDTGKRGESEVHGSVESSKTVAKYSTQKPLNKGVAVCPRQELQRK